MVVKNKRKARKLRAGCSWDTKKDRLAWNHKYRKKANRKKAGYISICRNKYSSRSANKAG